MEKYQQLLDKKIRRIILDALKEDCASQDLTNRFLLPKAQTAEGKIIAKEAGVLCGVEIAKAVFLEMDPKIKAQVLKKDGEMVLPKEEVLSIWGRSSKILSAERAALNFLQHLSGVASLTRQFVQAVKGTKAKIFDTRKTIPGLRWLQKYAVRCGGGLNHRMNLSEMAMVKDNHLFLMKSQRNCLKDLKSKCQNKVLVIEAKSIEEVQAALEARADIILLDNMEIPLLKKAVHFIRSKSFTAAKNFKPLIEVSGGINLKNVRKVAQLGVDRISIGQLTHSAKALDFSLEMRRIF
ncbi:MAG: carboxylating nicotinate-nucleotide diphosphorylase [Elusimicrobia bacterium]|nr:carboxylating nicotinate-nucleotide diphosphorylase [Elusimicrobiota bacterium]